MERMIWSVAAGEYLDKLALGVFESTPDAETFKNRHNTGRNFGSSAAYLETLPFFPAGSVPADDDVIDTGESEPDSTPSQHSRIMLNGTDRSGTGHSQED